MADTIVRIDVENTTLPLRNNHNCSFDALEVIEKAGGWTRIRDAIAYADFSRLPDAIARNLAHAGIHCRHVPRTNGSVSKDLVDFVLSLELLEATLMDPSIKRVVLVAGDADYIPAVSRARQAQKAVTLLAVEGALSHELRELVAGDVVFLEGGPALPRA